MLRLIQRFLKTVNAIEKKSKKNRDKQKVSFTLIEKLQIVINEHKTKKAKKKTVKKTYFEQMNKNIKALDVKSNIIQKN